MSSNPANTLPPQYDDALPADYDPEFTAHISTKMRVPDRIAVSERQNGFDTDQDWRQHSAATMNVPDKIVVMGRDERLGLKEEPKLHMDMNYSPAGDQHQYVGLHTPPRVLTLEDRPFPVTEEQESKPDYSLEWPEGYRSRQDTSLPNGYITPGTKHSSGYVQDTITNILDRTGETLSSVIERTFKPCTAGGTPIRHRHPSDSLTLEASMSTPGEGLLIQDEQADDMAVLRRQMAKLSRHVMRLEEENGRRSNRELVLYPLVICYVLFQVGKWFVQVK